MSDIVIKAEGLGKKYLIGHQSQEGRYMALRDVLARNVGNFWHKSKSLMLGESIVYGNCQEEVWALQDVNFEIQRGEAVGIIGHNGAGKSTLLKILSRITEPSIGRVTIRGRIASLLEVGTGFHPELTGRENIFLNGAILGMARQEIKRKFDEIVDFAEIERFLDTPVKRYSSGMYVRLAFSVAAHLDPEILVVDEVLAVGDASFQKKSLGKMQDNTKSGRTVILVSHNMAAIRYMTNSAILIGDGQIIRHGNPCDTIEHYLKISKKSFHRSVLSSNSLAPAIKHVGLLLSNGFNEVSAINCDDSVFLFFKIFTANQEKLVFGFTIYNMEDIGVFSGITTDEIDFLPQECREMRIKIPSQFLNPGEYRVEGALSGNSKIIEQNECYFTFTVYRNNRFDLTSNKSKGILRLSQGWEFNL